VTLAIFSQNPLYELHWIFFWSPSGENFTQKKALVGS
jgi:hypothetical protein